MSGSSGSLRSKIGRGVAKHSSRDCENVNSSQLSSSFRRCRQYTSRPWRDTTSVVDENYDVVHGDCGKVVQLQHWRSTRSAART